LSESSELDEPRNSRYNFGDNFADCLESSPHDLFTYAYNRHALGELFKRIFKSRVLGFLVTLTALIWIYGESFQSEPL